MDRGARNGEKLALSREVGSGLTSLNCSASSVTHLTSGRLLERQRSSMAWHEGRHDIFPWFNYFLATMRTAYREFAGKTKPWKLFVNGSNQFEFFVVRQ
jgi:hypothetical protein